jgi:hypothetical protein
VDLVEDASLTLIDPDAATVPLEIEPAPASRWCATEPDCNDCSCLVAQLDADIRRVVKALLLNSINHLHDSCPRTFIEGNLPEASSAAAPSPPILLILDAITKLVSQYIVAVSSKFPPPDPVRSSTSCIETIFEVTPIVVVVVIIIVVVIVVVVIVVVAIDAPTAAPVPSPAAVIPATACIEATAPTVTKIAIPVGLSISSSGQHSND